MLRGSWGKMIVTESCLFLLPGQMDDVLDHICALHNSRDVHGHLSLLVSTTGEGVFDLGWKENGNVCKGKREPKSSLSPEHGSSTFGCTEVFCLEKPRLLSQCCQEMEEKG